MLHTDLLNIAQNRSIDLDEPYKVSAENHFVVIQLQSIQLSLGLNK